MHYPKIYIWWSTKHDKYPRSHQHYRHLCAYLFLIILSISKYFPIQTGHKPRGCRCRLCIRKWETPHTLSIIFMTTGPGNESVWHCNTNITLLIFHFRQAFSAANLLNWLAVFSYSLFLYLPLWKKYLFLPIVVRESPFPSGPGDKWHVCCRLSDRSCDLTYEFSSHTFFSLFHFHPPQPPNRGDRGT